MHTNCGHNVGRKEPFRRPKHRWEEGKEMDEILITYEIEERYQLDATIYLLL